MKSNRWQDGVILVLGAWLFLSPFWMDAYASTSNAAAWNSYIMGVLLFAFAWAAFASRRIWEEWVNLAIGAWLIISPFVLAFYSGQPGAGWNHIVVGALVCIDAIWMLAQYSQLHKGLDARRTTPPH